AEERAVVVTRTRALQRALEVVPTVEVRADGRGVEVGPVVELHTLAKRKRVRLRVWTDLPVGGETGLQLGRPRLEVDQGLEDLRDDPDRLAVRDERAVERNRVRGAGEDERPARLPAAFARIVVAAPATGDHHHRHCKEQQNPPGRSEHLSPSLSLSHANGKYRNGRPRTRLVGASPGSTRRCAAPASSFCSTS